MRRKYDLRNKRNFVIILILSILIICIFSLFIYKYIRASRIEYAINTGSVLQDTNKNYIEIEEDAKLKVRWNGDYYLIYQDNKINLSKKVMVYDSVTGSMKLYGKFYEISEEGRIEETKGETVLKNTTDGKFYKIDDREYLVVDRQIFSDDKSIETKNYLLVELDKMGNAKLSNNKLNLKTITPTVLLTSKYTFDIANERLKYNLLDINLKKIIGSTNEYVEEAETIKGDSGSGTGENGEGGSGDWAGEGGSGVGGVVNNTGTGTVNDIGELKNKTKMTSIIRVQESLSKIDVDYVIYDPYNEYKSVYAEINKHGEIEVVYLSKNDTHVVFDNLRANTEYRIKFIYTTVNNETNEIIPNTFDDLTLRTNMPKYSISVYKISNVTKKLTYKVNLQEGFAVSRVNTHLSFNYSVTDPETGEVDIKNASINGYVTTNGTEKSVLGTFDISDYSIDEDTVLRLTVVSVQYGENELPINSSSTFRFGR
jgi:hypothetical protein